MKNKRGQFYLVAAIIIILAVSGIASIKTYASVRSEPRKIQDIGSELNEETIRIVDYGVYSRENITKIINNFTESEFGPYFLKKTENTTIVFIYGNSSQMYSVQYSEESTGSVFATLGGASPSWAVVYPHVERTSINPTGESVNVTIMNKEFKFDIKDNEMFYFLITQEKDGEFYVERN